MTLPLASITGALWSRIATDAAGAGVRALLTAGGVLTGAQVEGGVEALAALGVTPPFAVWREGVVAGAGDVMRRVTGAWWVYVPNADTRAQALIIEAIEGAYPLDAVALGRTEVGPIGQAAPDGAMGGLWARPVTISYSRR